MALCMYAFGSLSLSSVSMSVSTRIVSSLCTFVPPAPIAPPGLPPAPPSVPSEVLSDGTCICNNECQNAYNGACDDGGPGAEFTFCTYGTDCADCGPRLPPPPPRPFQKLSSHVGSGTAIDLGDCEVVAQDFVYSIKRHFDPKNRSQGAWLWQGKIVGLDQWKEDGADYDAEIEGLKALDDHTIQIKLVKPFPQLTYTLAMGFAALVPHEAVDAYGRELSVRPVGSGPFKLERFSTAKAVFVPNPNYRQEPVDLAAEGYDPALHADYGLEAIDGKAPPFVDRLEIDFITETASRWASFTSDKEVQYSHVPVEQVDSVLASKQPLELKPEWSDRYHSAHGTEAGFVYTYYNMDRPALGTSDDPEQDAKNKALRCAMVDAFSWAERNARFYSGIGNVFPGVITPVVPEFDPNTPRDSVTQDLAAAKQALEDAGWTPETLPEIVYGHVASVTNRQMFEQFRGFMAELGFPVDKVRGESYATFGDFNKGIKTNQFDVGGLGWGLDYPDAENTLQLFYGPNRTPGSNNANYSNPEFDALYEQTAVMQPGPERTAIYRKMNQMVIDDCVALTGLSRTRIYLWHKDVIGVPDREILGGFWLKYVDVKTDAGA